jgi:uroporphyrinogen-III decarboxylase
MKSSLLNASDLNKGDSLLMPESFDMTYKCGERDVISKVILDTAARRGVSFTDIYKNSLSIADFSMEVKLASGTEFCMLPFCHTVEAEALGGDIRQGDENAGARAGNLVYSSMEPIAVRSFDYSETARIRAMLDACGLINDRGEKVIYTVSGPFSILSCLMEPGIIFKAWRKKQPVVQQLFDHLADELLQYIQKACDMGAAYISYADPAGSERILGPHYAEQAAVQFTVGFLEKAQTVCRGQADILVCPLTAGMLTSLGLAGMQPAPPEPHTGALIPVCTNNMMPGEPFNRSLHLNK